MNTQNEVFYAEEALFFGNSTPQPPFDEHKWGVEILDPSRRVSWFCAQAAQPATEREGGLARFYETSGILRLSVVGYVTACESDEKIGRADP